MKMTTVAKTLATLALSLSLVACGAHTLTLEQLDEASGVKVTAENAGADDEVTSGGAITVADGDTIIISPCLDKGSFNLTITNQEDGTVVYDEKAEGRVMFQTGAVPGVYDVKVSGNKATGWMTVFAAPVDEITEQDASLAGALEELGVDPSIMSDGE